MKEKERDNEFAFSKIQVTSRFALTNEQLGIKDPKLPKTILSPDSIYAREKSYITTLRGSGKVSLEKANDIMYKVCGWYTDLNTVFSHHIKTYANDTEFASFWYYHQLVRLILSQYNFEVPLVSMIIRHKLTELTGLTVEDSKLVIAAAYRGIARDNARRALEALNVAEKCIDYSRIKIGNDYVMSRLNRLVIEEERQELLREFNKIKDFTIFQFIEYDVWRAVPPLVLALVGALVMDPIRIELFRDYMRNKAAELLGIPIG